MISELLTPIMAMSGLTILELIALIGLIIYILRG